MHHTLSVKYKSGYVHVGLNYMVIAELRQKPELGKADHSIHKYHLLLQCSCAGKR